LANDLKRPVIGALAAIGITTTMDANGLTNFSALPLCPLMLLCWYLERQPRPPMGFAWGRLRDYGLAVLHPLLVLSAVALIAFATGAVDLSHTDWRKAAGKAALISLTTFIMVSITEEGFFRGWLWGSLEKAGEKTGRVLLWTSVTFALWHVSWVTLTADGKLPLAQVPVFIVNVVVMGAIWGMLRWISGSVIVASLCHGIWNGIDYVFFAYGTKTGALGVANTAVYGPEVGYLGLALNVVFAAALWRWWITTRAV
jgi:CAAX protease family protein